MALTVRERIFAEVAMRLEAIAGTGFVRNPDRDIAAEEVPILVQYDGDDEPRDLISGAEQFDLTVGIEIYDATRDDGTAIQEMLGTVLVALAPVADVTLGGLAAYVKRGRVDDLLTLRDQGRETYRVLGFDLLIEYWTAEGDSRTLGP